MILPGSYIGSIHATAVLFACILRANGVRGAGTEEAFTTASTKHSVSFCCRFGVLFRPTGPRYKSSSSSGFYHSSFSIFYME
jgi:hypothetical protein